MKKHPFRRTEPIETILSMAEAQASPGAQRRQRGQRGPRRSRLAALGIRKYRNLRLLRNPNACRTLRLIPLCPS